MSPNVKQVHLLVTLLFPKPALLLYLHLVQRVKPALLLYLYTDLRVKPALLLLKWASELCLKHGKKWSWSPHMIMLLPSVFENFLYIELCAWG